MEMKQSMSNNRKNLITALSIVVLFIAAAAYVWFLTIKGILPSGNDIWGHLFKADIMYQNIKEGNWYLLYEPSWYNGIQLYRYWAPLPYYILALLQGICHGELINGYYMFAGFSIFFGGLPWIMMSRKHGHQILGLSFALLWFFLPESFRVYFCEGNFPRMMSAVLMPYLIWAIWLYVREGKKRTLIPIFIGTALMTLTHVMITGMFCVGTFVFLLFDFKRNKSFDKSFWVLCTMVCGIMLTGLWLIPALSGGMVSMDSEASANVMAMMMSDLGVSLNPMNRINGITDTFYYGISVVLLSVLGILLADKKKHAGYFLALLDRKSVV